MYLYQSPKSSMRIFLRHYNKVVSWKKKKRKLNNDRRSYAEDHLSSVLSEPNGYR